MDRSALTGLAFVWMPAQFAASQASCSEVEPNGTKGEASWQSEHRS